MTAPQPSTPFEFADELMESPHKLGEWTRLISARDAALLAPLRAEVERLTAALRPFAKCSTFHPEVPDDVAITVSGLTQGDFRAAARALAEGQP